MIPCLHCNVNARGLCRAAGRLDMGSLHKEAMLPGSCRGFSRSSSSICFLKTNSVAFRLEQWSHYKADFQCKSFAPWLLRSWAMFTLQNIQTAILFSLAMIECWWPMKHICGGLIWCNATPKSPKNHPNLLDQLINWILRDQLCTSKTGCLQAADLEEAGKASRWGEKKQEKTWSPPAICCPTYWSGSWNGEIVSGCQRNECPSALCFSPTALVPKTGRRAASCYTSWCFEPGSTFQQPKAERF